MVGLAPNCAIVWNSSKAPRLFRPTLGSAKNIVYDLTAMIAERIVRPDYYFIRVNGDTGHNDPGKPNSYVPGEPPKWPKRFFSYVSLCLTEGFVRIGWPATGDLRIVSRVPHATKAYALEPHV